MRAVLWICMPKAHTVNPVLDSQSCVGQSVLCWTVNPVLDSQSCVGQSILCWTVNPVLDRSKLVRAVLWICPPKAHASVRSALSRQAAVYHWEFSPSMSGVLSRACGGTLLISPADCNAKVEGRRSAQPSRPQPYWSSNATAKNADGWLPGRGPSQLPWACL